MNESFNVVEFLSDISDKNIKVDLIINHPYLGDLSDPHPRSYNIIVEDDNHKVCIEGSVDIDCCVESVNFDIYKKNTTIQEYFRLKRNKKYSEEECKIIFSFIETQVRKEFHKYKEKIKNQEQNDLQGEQKMSIDDKLIDRILQKIFRKNNKISDYENITKFINTLTLADIDLIRLYICLKESKDLTIKQWIELGKELDNDYINKDLLELISNLKCKIEMMKNLVIVINDMIGEDENVR